MWLDEYIRGIITKINEEYDEHCREMEEWKKTDPDSYWYFMMNERNP